MPTQKIYDLFISHAWRYNETYDRLVEMLKCASGFYGRIFSVYKYDMLQPNNPSDKELLLKDLERQINPVNCVLVISGMYAADKEWIQAEIDIARKKGKPIIIVTPQKSEHVPGEVQDAANTMVRWNSISIVDKIRSLSNEK
jgi:Thoeris protein ThsB, TIR-like domain